MDCSLAPAQNEIAERKSKSNCDGLSGVKYDKRRVLLLGDREKSSLLVKRE